MSRKSKITTSFDDTEVFISGTHPEVKAEVCRMAEKAGRSTDEYIIWRP